MHLQNEYTTAGEGGEGVRTEYLEQLSVRTIVQKYSTISINKFQSFLNGSNNSLLDRANEKNV